MIGILRRRRRLIDTALRVAFVVVLVLVAILRPTPAGDAHAYWMVDLADPYTRPVATQDAFTYPPPAALFFAGLRAVTLNFQVFEAIWTLVIGFALLWLTGPWALGFLVIPVVFSDLYLGNIHILLGAAIVASVRWPAAWWCHCSRSRPAALACCGSSRAASGGASGSRWRRRSRSPGSPRS